MGAPWHCKTCDCHWYSMGPTGGCPDCGEFDDIEIDMTPAGDDEPDEVATKTAT